MILPRAKLAGMSYPLSVGFLKLPVMRSLPRDVAQLFCEPHCRALSYGTSEQHDNSCAMRKALPLFGPLSQVYDGAKLFVESCHAFLALPEH